MPVPVVGEAGITAHKRSPKEIYLADIAPAVISAVSQQNTTVTSLETRGHFFEHLRQVADVKPDAAVVSQS